MSDSDSYGNAGMVDDVFASSTSSLKTTILVALAECLLHRPFKPGENDLVSCMKCTGKWVNRDCDPPWFCLAGPNTFYNLYCSLIKRESRFARTNDGILYSFQYHAYIFVQFGMRCKQVPSLSIWFMGFAKLFETFARCSELMRTCLEDWPRIQHDWPHWDIRIYPATKFWNCLSPWNRLSLLEYSQNLTDLVLWRNLLRRLSLT